MSLKFFFRLMIRSQGSKNLQSKSGQKGKNDFRRNPSPFFDITLSLIQLFNFTACDPVAGLGGCLLSPIRPSLSVVCQAWGRGGGLRGQDAKIKVNINRLK